MTPDALANWRLRMHWTQTQAAKQLGRSVAMYQYYEQGHHEIPLAVELATYELDRRFGGRTASKGCYLGQCNHAACTQRGATWFNRADGLYYCKPHALELNRRVSRSAPGRDVIEVCVEHRVSGNGTD